MTATLLAAALAAVPEGARAATPPFPDWHPHPDVWLLVAVVALGYWWGTRPAPPTRRQAVLFGLGLTTMWIASDWPTHDLGEGYLYSAHMVQHMLMTLVAPALLLLGVPAALGRRLLSPAAVRAAVRWLARPLPALVQFNVILVFSHWPFWVDLTLRHHGVHFLAHALLVVSAVLMWLPVLSPVPEVPRLNPPARMLYLFLQSIVPTVPASFLTFGSKPLYHFYETVPRLWGWSALSDQQSAGLIMKIVGGLLLWLAIGLVFFRWYADEEGEADVLTWDQVERELQQLGPGSPRGKG